MQLGRVSDARRILTACRDEALLQAARSSNASAGPDSPINSYAEMRANFLVDSQLWQDEVANWTLPVGDHPLAQLTFDYTDALVAYKSSNPTAARDAFLRAEAGLKQASAWLERRALDEPEELKNATILVEQLRALLSSLAANSPEVIAALKAVSAKERALPLDFGPPVIFKPTDELLGELCLHSNRLSEASAAFQSDLTRAPGRRLGTQGLAASAQQTLPDKPPAASAKPAAADNHVHN
jgi:hypothetical protein